MRSKAERRATRKRKSDRQKADAGKRLVTVWKHDHMCSRQGEIFKIPIPRGGTIANLAGTPVCEESMENMQFVREEWH